MTTTVILGGGIIGLSTAYYLSRAATARSSPNKIIIIDAAPRLLASASGFAGGFVARDWFSPSVASLGALSFDLHRRLADENDGRKRWGYSASTAFSLSIDHVGVSKKKGKDWLSEGTSRSQVASGAADGLSGGGQHLQEDEVLNADGSPRWVKRQPGGTVEVIGSEGGCAQVEPYRLCEFLRQKCEEAGVEIWVGTRAVGATTDGGGAVTGLQVQEADGERSSIECSNIVLAAGAWTPKAYRDIFPNSKLRIPIVSLAGHSCTVRSRHLNHHKNPLTTPEKLEGGETNDHGHHAIFSAPGLHWKSFAPEAISRVGRDGEAEVYVAGLNSSSMPLPQLPTESVIDEASRRELRKVTSLLTGDDELEVVREAVCFRPIVSSGPGPIIGKVQEVEMVGGGGLYVAGGHGPWGISLSLGTGKVVSEMVEGVKTSADVSGLGRPLR